MNSKSLLEKYNIRFEGERDNLRKVIFSASIKPMGEKDSFLSFNTSDAIRFVESEFGILVRDVIQACTVFNNSEHNRNGVWIFIDEVPIDEHWVYEDKDIIKSIQQGLEEADRGELIPMEEVFEEVEKKIKEIESQDVKSKRKSRKKK